MCISIFIMAIMALIVIQVVFYVRLESEDGDK